MKTRFPFLLILLCLFLFPDASFSGTWTDSNSNDTFSFTGTTVSTSTQHGGHGTTYYRVSGSADISGSADPLGDNTVYSATLWLSASGDINSSAFPGKDNIDTEKISDGVYSDSYTSGAATILYTSHPVGSLADGEFNPIAAQAKKSLSDSTSSPTYVKGSYSSPSGLNACPEVHGSLSGTLMNYVGSKSVNSLSFQSDGNCAGGGGGDDGSGSVANEICHRKQNCKLPGTATSTYSHRVKCPQQMWVRDDGVSFTTELFGWIKYNKKPCSGFWWTCDDDPNDPNTTNVCIQKPHHVKPGESSWRNKYVSPDGEVSQYPPSQASKHPCGDHNTSVSGDHSLQASCSSSNANGNCTVTSFYACDNHTHSYPSPPPPPPPPSLCPANAWTNCGNTSSDATTCGGGHTYYTCNSSAVAYHGDSQSCRRGGCSNTWSNCQSAPWCDAWQGNKCWAK